MGWRLGVALIILSLAIVQGFQRDVRDLVVGFGAHLTGGRRGSGPRPRRRDRVAWTDVDTAALARRKSGRSATFRLLPSGPPFWRQARRSKGCSSRGWAPMPTRIFWQRATCARGGLPDWPSGGRAVHGVVGVRGSTPESSGLEARSTGAAAVWPMRAGRASAQGLHRLRGSTSTGSAGIRRVSLSSAPSTTCRT